MVVKSELCVKHKFFPVKISIENSVKKCPNLVKIQTLSIFAQLKKKNLYYLVIVEPFLFSKRNGDDNKWVYKQKETGLHNF